MCETVGSHVVRGGNALHAFNAFKIQRPYWAIVQIEQKLGLYSLSGTLLVQSHDQEDLLTITTELAKLGAGDKNFSFEILDSYKQNASPSVSQEVSE